VQDGVCDAFTQHLAETPLRLRQPTASNRVRSSGVSIDMKAVEKVGAHIADAVKKGA